VSLMNQTAQSVGMKSTHFVDPSGSSWGNISTAHDLFTLAQYLYDNRSFILMMTTDSKDPNAYGPSVFTTLQNFNVFAGDPNFVGGKVGINGAASDTILSVFNGSFTVLAGTSTDMLGTSTLAANATTTEERPFMFVILGSNDYTTDADSMLTWIENTYK
jgi:D-alanyl-D-alanine carboxypeptidase